MEVRKVRENDSLTVAVDGYLDTLTAPDLESEMQGALEGINTLIFDFEKLAYISSAGLRVILAAKKAMSKGTMVLRHVNSDVKEIFNITGFSDVLTFE